MHVDVHTLKILGYTDTNVGFVLAPLRLNASVSSPCAL
jgi:hypothetical protein